MFYSKTAALAQHVGEITKILQEIYRDTDKKILDIELRNRAQCLILLGYTLRRRKTNKPFVPAEKSEWIQLYNNGACAMKDYCDMGMQVYVAKKCEDVKCLIVPGCAGGGGGGGGGGSNKSGGKDLLQDIIDKYKRATQIHETIFHTKIFLNFIKLEKAYRYLIENCETISGQNCKRAIFDFNSSYELILEIAKIIFYSKNEVQEYLLQLVENTNEFIALQLKLYDLLITTGKLTPDINKKIDNIISLNVELNEYLNGYNNTEQLSVLHNFAIEVFELIEKIYSFNINKK